MTSMNVKRVIVLCSTLLALAACGDTRHTSVDSTSRPVQTTDAVPSIPTPPNPVAVLKLAGCIIPSDIVMGQPAYLSEVSSYFATCAWGPNPNGGSQTLEVWMYKNDADRNVDIPSVTLQDGRTIIVGHPFIAELNSACCGESDQVTPTEVARRINGSIVK